MRIPRIMFAAPSSGSGKTLITCGVLQALINRGMKISSYKCGPDYIDPMFHEAVIGAKSRNLDTFFAKENVVRYLFARSFAEQDFALIEGVMGYFDGLGGMSVEASSFDVARVTETPVVLIVNAKGMSLSVLAMIKGFIEYEKSMRKGKGFISGVILNQTSGMIYGGLKKEIEGQLGIRVLGYVPKNDELVIESRHLGLIKPEEIPELKNTLNQLAMQLEETLEIDELIELGNSAPEIYAAEGRENGWCQEETGDSIVWPEQIQIKRAGSDQENIRIGMACDEAFCFYYADNLQLLSELGAEIVKFSPLTEKRLPRRLSGLIFGGGYPELYLDRLSSNHQMTADIRQAVHGGMPCLAECGGFMYLHKTIEDMEGNEYNGVGIIQGKAYRTEKLGRFGYITLEAEEDNLLGKKGDKIPAHEFHYWDSTCCGETFTAKKPAGRKSWKCMVSQNNLLAGFPHLYFYGNTAVAENFIRQCRQYRSNFTKCKG